jgi:uncharacterized Zn-finger protein
MNFYKTPRRNTTMVIKNTKHTVECDLCHREFTLTREVLKEEQVTLLPEDAEPHEAVLTNLHCPYCGKHYPVVLDDESTLPLLDKLRNILAKQVKQQQRGFSLDKDTEKKRQELNRKLDFRRQKLAMKYNKSFYQLEDGTREQLEYRYHAR